MFGPRDPQPPPIKKAATFRLVFEGSKPFVVISHGAPDDWVKYELNLSQVASFIMDGLPRVVRR
jgi:hypothetical protein